MKRNADILILVAKRQLRKKKVADSSKSNAHGRENAICGMMVATRLAKYFDEIPQMGRIVSIGETDFTIAWWIGAVIMQSGLSGNVMEK